MPFRVRNKTSSKLIYKEKDQMQIGTELVALPLPRF